MMVESSFLLTVEPHHFAKDLVKAGRYWRSCLSQGTSEKPATFSVIW
jgi:hypothetical protein